LGFDALGVLALFSTAGFTLKLADLGGELRISNLAFFSAGICGILFGILIAESSFSSAIVSGIVLGVAVAGKINRVNLVFGLAVATLTAFILGFSVPLVWLLLIAALFAFLDEILHDRFAVRAGLLNGLFAYRCCLKLAVIGLAVLNLLPLLYAGGFLLFDITYDVAAVLFDRLGVVPWLRKF